MVFKQLRSGLSKFFTPNRIFIMVIFLVLAYALLSYSNTKQWSRMDLMTNAGVDAGSPSSSSDVIQNPNAQIQAGNPPVSDVSNAYVPVPTATNPSDLLPADNNSAWGQMNPALTNNGIQTPDLLQAGALVGLDTIGQSMRNANLQLRSDPIIPKNTNVGPWNQSTIEPDLMQAPFEINGGGAR